MRPKSSATDVFKKPIVTSIDDETKRAGSAGPQFNNPFNKNNNIYNINNKLSNSNFNINNNNNNNNNNNFFFLTNSFFLILQYILHKQSI